MDLASCNLLIHKCVFIDYELEKVITAPSPIKYIFANNIRTGARIRYIPMSRPFLIPFKIDNFIIRIGYYHQDYGGSKEY